MRRFILICMMLLLPYQWSWSAAGTVCEHETGGKHFGHHVHMHQATDADGDRDQDDNVRGTHPDCDACHTHVVGCLPGPCFIGEVWVAAVHEVDPGRRLPDPFLDSLLRPPLNLVA